MFDGIIDKFYLNNHPDGKPPKRFIKGILLLYLALVLQTVNNVLDGFNFSAAFFVFFFAGYLIYATGEGVKWARAVLSVLILLNVFALVVNCIYSIEVIPAYLLLSLCIEVIIEILALVLIFTKQADGWFNREKVNHFK